MIDPDRVRGVAEEVLSRPAYAELRERPLARVVAEVRSWIAEQLFDLLGGATAAGIGAVLAVLVVAVVVGLGVVALLGAQRRAAADLVVDEVEAATPARAMAAADAARAAGDPVDAVRHRYGALLLELQARDVVPRLPGLTVGEVDAAVGAAVPSVAPAVVAAGQALADIVYGHRAATVADDDLVADAVHEVRRAVSQQAVHA